MKLQIPAFDALQWAATIVSILVVIGVVVWVATSPAREARTAAVARAGGIQSAANSAAAHDAASITDGAHNSATSIEQTTRENADAIRHAPGADQPLNPDLNRVALQRLCHRPSYARTSQCLQLAHPGEPAR